MKETQISITEVTVLSGKKKAFRLNVNGVDVEIPVDAALFAHYQDQFVHNTPKQKKIFATLLSLMRAAYLKGCDDGEKEE